MKILQIISREHNRSGSGVQMMQLSLELDRRGHDVTAVYQYDPKSNSDFDAYKDSNIALLRIPIKSQTLKPSGLVDVFTIRRLIKRGGFDLIHTHSSAIDHVFLATIGINIPVVSNRGMSAKLNWVKGIKYRSDRVNRAIAVSKDIKKIMMETGSIESSKIDVIYGSVDPDRFSPMLKENSKASDALISRKKLSIPEDAYVMGYTGSIGGRKGINFLLDAFNHVIQKMPEREVYLLLVGISEEKLQASGFDMQSTAAKKIVCAGFQHQPEYHMAIFDLFVFPGIRDEGLTGAIREAASMKIPAISTDNGGNRELIIDKETGLMVPIKDTKALSDAMLFALNNETEMATMAENAYQLVMDCMTVEKRTDAVEALYKEVSR